jgi:hypothetical protein
MNWRYLGNISEARTSGCSGVYMIIHKGKYDRIVYVGTSINVGTRMSQHYNGYLRGNRSIYRVKPTEDIYSLMSSVSLHNHIKFYKLLASQKRIWASTTIEKINPDNLLAPDQSFCENWKEFLEKIYLPQLCVWALPMPNFTHEKAAYIESAIQIKIIDTFDLRGFFNVRNISILGKIEYNHKLIKLERPFDNLPLVDNASRIVLGDINKFDISPTARIEANEQLKDFITQRAKQKKENSERRERLRTKYPNHGKPWTLEDLEILRVLLTEFNLKSSEIAIYLHRKAGTIAKKIEVNDKISGRRWREDIKWL